MHGDTCTVLLPSPLGPSKFRSTVVKRIFPAESPENLDESLSPIYAAPTALILTIHSNNKMDYRSGFQAALQSPDVQKFSSSRQNEVNALFEGGVFFLSHKDDAQGLRVYGARFVDLVKHEGTPNAVKKSRLVIQGFNDKHCFLTHAPTVQQASLRPLLSFAACDDRMEVISRNVLQAYVQSETNFQRPVYVKLPITLGFSHNTFFKVNRPLYGLPESGNYWFPT